MQSAVGLEPSEISATISLPVVNRVLHGDSVCDTYFDPENYTVCTNEECSDELKYSLLQSLDSTTYGIFCICGLVWKENNTLSSILHNGWNCLVFAVVAAPAIYTLSLSPLALASSAKLSFYFSIISFALWFQAIAIVLSNYKNGVRLHLKINALEIASFESVKMVTWISTLTATLGTIAMPIYFSISYHADSQALLFSVVMLFPLAVVNGINFQFLLADAHYGYTVLKKMATGAEGHLLSLRDVDFVRAQVNRVVDRGYFSATSLMACALINMFCIFIIVLLLGYSDALLFDFFALFFKEIVFALIGLCFVAFVNEASRECVCVLGRRLAAQRNLSAHDMRISLILQSLQSCPIEFSLVHMVLTRKDIAVRFEIRKWRTQSKITWMI
jgi:hypothetical protein